MLALTVPIIDFELRPAVVLLGAISGLAYSLFGIGIALTYQSSRVLNFAQGAMGAVPAVLVATLVHDQGWGYWPALLTALVVGAGSGALLERFVIRRLTRAPRLVALVATIGAAQVIAIPIVFLVDPSDTKIQLERYPVPFDVSFTFDGFRFGPSHVLFLVICPIVLTALTLFLRRTTLGLASRAAAENEDAASLSGIPVHRIAMIVWTLTGLLAAVSGVLSGALGSGTGNAATNAASGGNLLLFGLGAAMIGGLRSLPQVFAAGIGLGVVLAVFDANTEGGVHLLVAVGLVLAALVLRSDLRELVRGGEQSNWSLSEGVRALPHHVRQHPAVRRAHLGMIGGLLLIAILVPLQSGPSQQVLYSAILMYALVGMSLVVLTGWTGQVSLGHFTFVGLGAYVGGRMHQLGYEPSAALAVVVAAGVAAAVIIGLPALRLRGLFLAVTTLAFAVAANTWLFEQSWLVQNTGDANSTVLRRRSWGAFDFQDELTYYYLLLAVTTLVGFGVYHVRTTGIYRALIAVRDNEPMASTLTLSPSRIKLLSFVLSGGLACFAGYLYGMLLVNFGQYGLSSTGNSLLMVTMVIIGGTTTVTGAVVGAAYVRGIPYFFDSTFAILASSGIGLLVVLLFLRGGLAMVLFRLRDRVVERLVGDMPEQGLGSTRPLRLEPRPRAHDPSDGAAPAIEARNVRKAYGGILAVADASLSAQPGEIVGLLGPNGAGKTTLFDIVSGLTRPDEGQILLNGHDVTDLSTAERAWLGLGRSFQQANLLDGLTILETFALSLERTEPSEVVPSLLGLPPSRAAERDKRRVAQDLVDLLGLGPFAEKTAPELSTGTRRIAELGCLIGSGADVILLDEPTGGVAQREVEAFVGVLRQVRDHLDATMVVVAHDIPMIASLVDRLYVLSSGSVIAEGDPSLLQTDERVMAAYLGTGTPSGAEPEPERDLLGVHQ